MKYLLWLMAAVGMCGCTHSNTVSYLSPNVATQHDHNLRVVMDRSIAHQEYMDIIDDMYMPLK